MILSRLAVPASALVLASCASTLPGSGSHGQELAPWVGDYSGAGCLRMAQHEYTATGRTGAGMRWFRSVLQSDEMDSGTGGTVTHADLCRSHAAFRPLATPSEIETLSKASPQIAMWQAGRDAAGLDTVMAGLTRVSITRRDEHLLLTASLVDGDGRVHRLLGEPIPLRPSEHTGRRRALPAGSLTGYAAVGDSAEVHFTLIREQHSLRGVWRLTEPPDAQRRWQGEVAFAFLDLRQE